MPRAGGSRSRISEVALADTGERRARSAVRRSAWELHRVGERAARHPLVRPRSLRSVLRATLAFDGGLGDKCRALAARSRSLLLLVGLLGTIPTAALAEEPTRPLESRPELLPPRAARSRVLLTGLAITGSFYALSLGSSYLYPDAPGATALRVPVAGPWLALGETGCRDDEPNCPVFPVVLRAVLTSIDGLAQIGGLAIASESLWLPKSPRNNVGFRAAPIAIGRGGVGIGVSGRF